MGRSRGGKRRRGEGNGWDGFGGYMQAKIQKLQGQFGSDEEKNAFKKSDIFNGVSIHVNGYTNPTWSILRDLMKTHGGIYQHYYSRQRVTHVIATNLAGSKAASLSPDVKVCSPNWITDSIKEGRLLPYEDYLLYTARKNKQPGLNVTRITRSSTTGSHLSDASGVEIGREESESVTESDGRTVEKESNDADGPNEDEGVDDQEVDADGGWNESNMDLFDDVDDWEEKSSSEDENKDDDDDDDEKSGASQDRTIQTRRKPDDLTSEVESAVEDTGFAPGVSKMIFTPKKVQPEVTSPPPIKPPTYGPAAKAGDPNFIGEFYTNSRLHYLSTWGAEFRAYVNELQNKGSNFPGRQRLFESGIGEKLIPKNLKINQKAQRVIMHIDMDSFFVAVGLRNRPELKGKPVAVTHSRGRGAKERQGTDPQFESERWKSKRRERSRFNKSKHSNLDPEENPDLLLMGGSDEEDEGTSSENKSSESIALSTPQEVFHSMAEIASCSYEAREAGVKNGMFMGAAKKLCPDLITIPYDFEGYKEVSQKLYDIVASYTHDIEAVSCDEMMVDLTELLESTGISPLDFATILRDEIQEATRCNASAGLGPNILIARMATRQAKPNGQHWVQAHEVIGYIKDRNISELPGVGRAMSRKLQSMGVENCGDLQNISLQVLQKEFGPKTGQALHKSCRGQDDRPIKVERERKSVSAEINYGIRFTKESEATKFLEDLAQEVHNRMEKIKVKAKTFTLKLKVRSPDAPRETTKFMGHGICDNVAKSVTLPLATDSADIIARECIVMLKNLKIKAEELRGIGIQGSRLESATFGQRLAQAPGMQSILNFATKIQQPEKTAEENKVVNSAKLQSTSPLKRKDLNEKVSESSVSEVGVGMEVKGQGHDDHSEDDDVDAIPFGNLNTSLPPLPALPDLSSSFSSQQVSFVTAVTPVREPRKQDDEFFFSPSQIDLKVLGELPEDIRKQVLQDMQRQRNQKRARMYETHDVPSGVKPQSSVAPPGGSATHNSQEPGCSHWSDKPNIGQVLTPDGSDDDDDIDVRILSEETVDERPRGPNRDAIVPLPSYSQIDPTFLDALPPDLRNEINNAYAADNRAKEATRLPMMPTEKPKNSPTTSPYKTFENLMAAGRSPSKANIGRSPKKSPGKVVGSRGRGSRGRGSRGRGSRGRAKASLTEMLSPKKPGVAEVKTPEKETPVQRDDAELPWTHQPPDLCGATDLPAVKSLLTEWINSSNEPENEDSNQVVQYLNQLIQEKYLDVCHLVLKFLLRFISRKNVAAWTKCLDTIVAKTQNIVIAFHGAPLKL